jgi:glycine/D-amino acid oxidase-like deaminating enzyme
LKAGAEIFERPRVAALQRESSQGESGWKITTSRGALWAREVFVATSGYTGKATPALQRNYSDRLVHHHNRSSAEKRWPTNSARATA